jgi:hypothetical protein
MSEETTTVEETVATTTETEEVEEAKIPRSRLNAETAKRKEAEQRLAALEAKMAERENEGLPELERERKAREGLEKRLQDAEKAREDADQAVQTARAERLVITAAKEFADPDDATRFVDLASIESADDAERAVKRVAKAKPHLLKSEERQLPGRVLANGRPDSEKTKGNGIDPLSDAAVIAEGLRRFASPGARE